jgi:hypothetical protein
MSLAVYKQNNYAMQNRIYLGNVRTVGSCTEISPRIFVLQHPFLLPTAAFSLKGKIGQTSCACDFYHNISYPCTLAEYIASYYLTCLYVYIWIGKYKY